MNKKKKLGKVVKSWKGYNIRHLDKGFGIYAGKNLVYGGYKTVDEAVKEIDFVNS